MMMANQPYRAQRWERLIAHTAMSGLGFLAAWSLASPTAHSAESLCPEPALQRLETHAVQSGQTLESIAASYNLLPITLLALNPSIGNGALSPGTALRIPPFNGAAVTVPAGQTWQDLATTYGARADVLFEVNGCPPQMPTQVFIPGVSWLIEGSTPSATTGNTVNTPLSTYPLAAAGQVIANYGWQTDPVRNELVFSSGITVETALATAVVAAGSGTVAYVGSDPALGTLIVVNHQQGLQTRYGQVTQPQVSMGDRVQAGQSLAIATPHTEDSSILYFEVRINSSLGWVARDPGDYIPALAVR
ncbi:M23 family metallopeptidase [Halomicronema sp. CCY15110]|uniref:peptidoglycan DD-metalloendopeptidase family protein n=1 Tax=Halomicronema sp. CCY15110 TaxID=2767773 RepID=UPI00194E6579|nr:M23 family metallopeptidase [Halomicronema sp. CCY15110]